EHPAARIFAQRGWRGVLHEGPLCSAPETLGAEREDWLTDSATARAAFERVIPLRIDTECLVDIPPLLRYGDHESQLRTAAQRGCKGAIDEGPLGSAPETLGEEL